MAKILEPTTTNLNINMNVLLVFNNQITILVILKLEWQKLNGWWGGSMNTQDYNTILLQEIMRKTNCKETTCRSVKMYEYNESTVPRIPSSLVQINFLYSLSVEKYVCPWDPLANLQISPLYRLHYLQYLHLSKQHCSLLFFLPTLHNSDDQSCSLCMSTIHCSHAELGADR